VTRRTACWAAVALCATACVGARPRVPSKVLEGWQSIAAGDVRIVAQASARDAVAFASDLAGFDAAFAHLLGARIASSEPTTIYLIQDSQLAGQFGLGSRIGGWTFGTFEGSLACVLLESKTWTRITLFHEYAHILLSRHRQSPMPRWYNEGLADYFSTLSMRDGSVVAGEVLGSRLQSLAAHGAMPLARLFAEPPGTEMDAFYATAWALVHYLLGTPRGRTELSRFEKELAQGVPLDEARERAFGRPLEALQRELAQHIDYLKRGVQTAVVLDPRQIPIAQPPAPVPLAAHEVAGQLGSLALAQVEFEGWEEPEPGGFLAISRTLLDTAVRTETVADARVRARLGFARALSGDFKGAAAEIERARDLQPGDPEVLLRAGQISLANGALDDAESHFRGALAIDDRFASAWLGLGRTFDRRAAPDAALEAFGRARAIAWSAPLDLEIGRLYLAAGRNDEALAALQPLAQDPDGGRIAKRAAELLRNAGLEPKAGG